MNMNSLFRGLAVVIAASALTAVATSTNGFAAEKESKKSTASTEAVTEQPQAPKAEEKSKTTESVQEDVEATVEDKTDEKRKQLGKEAVAAVESTRKALALLGENKNDEALAALKEAIGTLELVIARNPEMAYVPVLVTTKVHDLFAKLETVQETIEAAQDALDDGYVQTARRLLSNLASEMIISTHELPLATYPEAIKAAVPLIDEGKTDEAKQQIQTALNSFVVRNLVIPLPETRVKAMLTEAEELAEMKNRTDKQNERLKKLLDAAGKEMQFGEALGYIVDDEADRIFEELEAIRGKTSDGKSGKGFFDKIRGLFDW